MPVDIRDIETLVADQERWRGRETINLIASENAQSRAVRDVQNSDFMARYAEGHPNEEGRINRYYQGTQFIDEGQRLFSTSRRTYNVDEGASAQHLLDYFANVG